MKRLLTLTAIVALSAGCTRTQVDSSTFKINRTSFLQRVDIAEASANPDGTFLLKGYRNDGGNEALVNALVAMSQMMGQMQALYGLPTTAPAAPRSAPRRSSVPTPAPPDPFVVAPAVPNNSAP